MKIERTKNATRNIVFGGILKIYQIIVPFIMRTAMIYFMGTQYLGLNSLFTSILQVLNLAELGVGSAMVYSMYKPIAEDNTEEICALMRLYRTYYRIIGLVIAALGMILLPFIPRLIKGTIPSELNIYVLYLLNLGATVLSYWLFAYKNCLLSAHQRIDISSKVALVTNSIQYGLQLLALYLFHDYYIYVIVALFTQALTNVLTAVIVTKQYPQYRPRGGIDKKLVKNINQRIKDLFTAKLGGTIVNSADTVVISAFLGLTVLAVYQNYYFIMTSVIGFIGIIFNSCTAGIGNSLVVDTKEKIYNDFEKFVFLISWIANICVCCFLCMYQPFMILWVGEDLLLSVPCVVLFCCYFYLYVLQNLFCTYKDAGGIWHEDRFRPLVGALVNLILNLCFVRVMGIYAILLSTIASYLLVAMPWVIHNLFKLLFKKPIKSCLKKLFIYGCITLISSIICWIACSYLPRTGIVTLVIRLIVCVIIPNVLFIAFFRKTKEFAGVLELIDKISKGKSNKITEFVIRRFC